MNSRIKSFKNVNPENISQTDFKEPDRIKDTTKIRTFVNCGFLFSKESSMDKLIKRALLCSENTLEKEETVQRRLYKN